MSSSTKEKEPPRKTRRMDEEQVNSVPRLSSLGLKDALGNILESGDHADVIFIMGGGHGQIGRRQFLAHKCILSARSEVFWAMMQERWNNGSSSLTLNSGDNPNIIRIEMDPSINANAFEQIIKFIYKDDVDSCLSCLKFAELFEFRSLSEMYGFTKLKEAASNKTALDLVKDYRKCFFTLEQEIVDQDLRNVAFSVLKWNLAEALAADDWPSRWTEQIWENVLMDESLAVEEILLFQGLWRWKEHAPSSREGAFQKLLQLIRFPIMSSSELLAVVRPTDVLFTDELLNILQYQIDNITPAQQKPQIQFSTEKRGKKVNWVTSFKELMQTLEEISVIEDEDGTVEIFLLPGDYSSGIHVNKGFVKLTGFGPYTRLQGRDMVIKMTSNTTLDNLTLQSGMTKLFVAGNCNVVQNIVVSCKNPMFALVVHGQSNIFKNFSIQSYCTSDLSLLSKDELDFEFDEKDFIASCKKEELRIKENLTFPAGGRDLFYKFKSLRFVACYGMRNKFSTFDITFVLKNRNSVIVPLDHTILRMFKDNNVIEDVNFRDGMSSFFESPTLKLNLRIKPVGVLLVANCTDLVVSNCCFERIAIRELSEKHQFIRVISASTITVEGSGHKFQDCKYGQIVDKSENTVMSNCVQIPSGLTH